VARWWGTLPNERLKTALVARLGPRFIVSTWAVIVDERGRVLLFHHTHDRRHPWGLPSGRLESDETPETAMAREFREEVSGALHVRRLVAALREPQLPALRLVYACDIAIPPARPSVEVDAWAYFSLSDLPFGVRPLQREAISLAQVEQPRAGSPPLVHAVRS
jgi:ADP-ribose pyrophosphatase YjhB (NUDIX family)